MGISVYGIKKFGLIKKPLGVGKGRVAVTIPVKILALEKYFDFNMHFCRQNVVKYTSVSGLAVGGVVKLILATPVFSQELLQQPFPKLSELPMSSHLPELCPGLPSLPCIGD